MTSTTILPLAPALSPTPTRRAGLHYLLLGLVLAVTLPACDDGGETTSDDNATEGVESTDTDTDADTDATSTGNGPNAPTGGFASIGGNSDSDTDTDTDTDGEDGGKRDGAR